MYRLADSALSDDREGLQALVAAPAGRRCRRAISAAAISGSCPTIRGAVPIITPRPGKHGAVDIWTLGADGKEGGEGTMPISATGSKRAAHPAHAVRRRATAARFHAGRADGRARDHRAGVGARWCWRCPIRAGGCVDEAARFAARARAAHDNAVIEARAGQPVGVARRLWLRRGAAGAWAPLTEKPLSVARWSDGARARSARPGGRASCSIRPGWPIAPLDVTLVRDARARDGRGSTPTGRAASVDRR